MRQYTASEVETIVRDEVTLSLEALIRVGARRMLQAALARSTAGVKLTLSILPPWNSSAAVNTAAPER